MHKKCFPGLLGAVASKVAGISGKSIIFVLLQTKIRTVAVLASLSELHLVETFTLLAIVFPEGTFCSVQFVEVSSGCTGI